MKRGLVVLALLGAACESGPEYPKNGSAASKVVTVWESAAYITVHRSCDGPHLLYVAVSGRGGGVAVVPNGCVK
jgi:hypothetical protein